MLNIAASSRFILMAAVVSMIIVSGCGQQQNGKEAGSFDDALGEKAALEIDKETSDGMDNVLKGATGATDTANGAGSSAMSASTSPPSSGEEGMVASNSTLPSTGAVSGLPATSDQEPQATAVSPKSTILPPQATEVPQATTIPQSTKLPVTKRASQATSAPGKKYTEISWNGFFDNEDQSTPSDAFWDLSEANKTVQIKGFMGEVMSFENNWFLLIPEPGAECPFDNGDETYWNKIMIVFVKDSDKLRYTSEPLQLTGRLDVGIKVDESGYKTMFRIYDAKIEVLKD